MAAREELYQARLVDSVLEQNLSLKIASQRLAIFFHYCCGCRSKEAQIF